MSVQNLYRNRLNESIGKDIDGLGSQYHRQWREVIKSLRDDKPLTDRHIMFLDTQQERERER